MRSFLYKKVLCEVLTVLEFLLAAFGKRKYAKSCKIINPLFSPEMSLDKLFY
jgi:hypothetical protein